MDLKKRLKNIFSRIRLDLGLVPVKIVLLTALVGLCSFIAYNANQKHELTAKTQNKNIYVSYLLEVYDKIKENYWENLSDEQIVDLYVLGSEKLLGQPQALKTKNRDSLEKILTEALKDIDTDQKKKDFTTTLADTVLQNLKPLGRSKLYSQKDETALKNTVNNVNPEVDQYKILGISKEASSSQITDAYTKQSQKWDPKKNSDPQAQKKFEEITKAYQVLFDESNRKLYDTSGVEPTMDYKFISPEIFYIHIKKFSPTTQEELLKVTDKSNLHPDADTLIFDLRDNIGGAIDGLPWFLGPFIGPDQYSYQFFHKGEKQDFKTLAGFLPGLLKFKKTVVLINEGSQSTAEVMAAALKKYNVGVLVGVPTKGWGTVEKVFPLTTKLDPSQKDSVFLVHSLTLRDDGQPIEGRGVDPTINITDPNWQKLLYAYFRYPELADAIKNIWNEKPLQ